MADSSKYQNHAKKADYYDDPKYTYANYWIGREYEQAAEKMAINRLLEGKHFRHAVDIGGGYGRLSVLLKKFADVVTLVEPSERQLAFAGEYLKNHPLIHRRLMQADTLDFDTGSIDLAIMIRVLHHIPDPSAEFNELSRVLAKDGLAILEVANYTHGRNRLRHALQRKKLPIGPVSLKSLEKDKDITPFVNHNPKTIIRQLDQAGLTVERILSVSNLRSTKLKKYMPHSIMLAIEGILQPTLAHGYFGPSVFLLVRKSK